MRIADYKAASQKLDEYACSFRTINQLVQGKIFIVRKIKGIMEPSEFAKIMDGRMVDKTIKSIRYNLITGNIEASVKCQVRINPFNFIQ